MKQFRVSPVNKKPRSIILIFAEQAPPRAVIAGGFGPAGKEIRNTARIFSNSWESSGTQCIGFRTCPKPQIPEPAVDTMQGSVVAAVLFGIALRRGAPVLLGEEMILQDADVAQCERQPATETGITSGGRIADQHDAFAVREIDPAIRSVERSERPDRPGIIEPFRRGTRRNRQVEKDAVILGAAEGYPAVMTETDIGAKAPTADRDNDRKPLYSGIQNKLNRILRQRQISVDDARDRKAPRIPADRKITPAPHFRMSPISADHQTRGNLLLAAVLAQPDGRGISGNDADYFGRSPQLDVRLHGYIEQPLLHFRMIEVQTRKPRR